MKNTFVEHFDRLRLRLKGVSKMNGFREFVIRKYPKVLNRGELSPSILVCFAMLTFKALIHVASISSSTFIKF